LANPPRNRKEEDIANSQRGLLDALGGHASGVSSSIDELRDTIAKELEGRGVFVIVDDVWAPDAVQAFSIHADGSAILLTSRRARDFELSGISVTLSKCSMLKLLQPEIVVRWHRTGSRAYWPEGEKEALQRRVDQHCGP
jgi:hypothetical protein